MTAKPLMRRVTELVEELGTNWKAIAERLESAGYSNKQGLPYSKEAIRKRWNKYRVQQTREVSPESSDTSDTMVLRTELDELRGPNRQPHACSES